MHKKKVDYKKEHFFILLYQIKRTHKVFFVTEDIVEQGLTRHCKWDINFFSHW